MGRAADGKDATAFSQILVPLTHTRPFSVINILKLRFFIFLIPAAGDNGTAGGNDADERFWGGPLTQSALLRRPATPE